MLNYTVSLNHIHKSCIAFQDNLYKYKRKVLSHGLSYTKCLPLETGRGNGKTRYI